LKNLLLEIKEGIIISLTAIKANKSRSFLAKLGIVIGITTVTILQTAIEGINRAFEKSIAAVGADVLYVQKFEWFGKEDWEVTATGGTLHGRNTNTLKKIWKVLNLFHLQSAIWPR
jgi:putative ABC transport system permease protein